MTIVCVSELGDDHLEGSLVASRETLLARTFVDVSDTLVLDFDVVDFLSVLAGRCDELLIPQALADVATIGILQHRAASESRLISEQLQYALNSRIVIEQAKGVLGARAGLDMDEAFTSIRAWPQRAARRGCAGNRARTPRRNHSARRAEREVLTRSAPVRAQPVR